MCWSRSYEYPSLLCLWDSTCLAILHRRVARGSDYSSFMPVGNMLLTLHWSGVVVRSIFWAYNSYSRMLNEMHYRNIPAVYLPLIRPEKQPTGNWSLGMDLQLSKCELMPYSIICLSTREYSGVGCLGWIMGVKNRR